MKRYEFSTILDPKANQSIRQSNLLWRLWIVLVVLIFLLGAAISIYGQEPDAPKPQGFFQNNTNRALVASDVNIRLMDAISTQQMLDNPCHCFYEKNIPSVIAKTPVLNYGYSLGVAAGYAYLSSKLWNMSNHTKNRRAKTIYRFAARAIPIGDSLYDVMIGPVNNWRLIGGRK